jgi:homoserine O-succinyltransferase/O-acetyltransferase
VSGSECIEIGLVNNMPDAALKATERQFVELLDGAAGDDFLVRLQFFSLPEVSRGAIAAAHLHTAYGNVDDLFASQLDALIVTGTEPRARLLSNEPYWDSLTKLINWAEHNTRSTIWSCLAAHAAVLHLDGIDRNPCAEKRSGVFECVKVAADELLTGTPTPLQTVHSRWNDLHERELVLHGYRVLTRSPEVGVDMFVKKCRSLFVFFQGHPEYDADSLLREYRRDVERFLRGESTIYPATPDGYFDTPTERALAAFGARARVDRHPPQFVDFPDALKLRPPLLAGLRSSWTPVFRSWLSCVTVRKKFHRRGKSRSVGGYPRNQSQRMT